MVKRAGCVVKWSGQLREASNGRERRRRNGRLIPLRSNSLVVSGNGVRKMVMGAENVFAVIRTGCCSDETVT